MLAMQCNPRGAHVGAVLVQVVSSGQEAAQLRSLQDKVQLNCCMAPCFEFKSFSGLSRHSHWLQAAGRHEEKQKQLRNRNAEIVRENTACAACMIWKQQAAPVLSAER